MTLADLARGSTHMTRLLPLCLVIFWSGCTCNNVIADPGDGGSAGGAAGGASSQGGGTGTSGGTVASGLGGGSAVVCGAIGEPCCEHLHRDAGGLPQQRLCGVRRRGVRASLDARHGDRAAWLKALSPLVLPPACPWLTAGVVLMENKVRVAVVIAIVAVGSFLAGGAWSSSPEPSGRDTSGASAQRAEPRGPALPPVAERGLAPARDTVATPAATPRRDIGAPTSPGTPAAAPPTASSAPTPTAPAAVATTPAPTDAGVRFAVDREGIRAAMRSALPEVKDCYEAWLKLNPSLGGKLVVTLTIDTDDGVEGRVSRIAPLDAGLGHVPFEGCVLSSLADLRFEPPLAGPVNVSYPFLFSAADAGQ